MELVLDHVMFPVYNNDALLDLVATQWRNGRRWRVETPGRGLAFKHVIAHSRSFYVESLSTVQSQPYWSNAVYIVVPKEHWSHYAKPALVTEHFLVPRFGCGFQLVNPDYPFRNAVVGRKETFDGFTLLISKALERELSRACGLSWELPRNGKVRVHDDLHHLHDMVVVDADGGRVAPLFEANPLLRETIR